MTERIEISLKVNSRNELIKLSNLSMKLVELFEIHTDFESNLGNVEGSNRDDNAS